MVIFNHVSSLFLSALQLKVRDDGFFSYQFAYCFTLCVVAIFVMISGVLLLSKNEPITYTRVFQHYIPRILWALVIFALPMCFIEQLMNNRGAATMDILASSIQNFLTGLSWTHMWYLYMLPGLYLITPLLHTFLLNSTKQEHTQLLMALAIMGIVIPNISMLTGIDMQSYMMLPSFIATYYIGFYIHKYSCDNHKTICCSLVCLVAYTLYCYLIADVTKPIVGPEFILSIAVAGALICISRRWTMLPSLCKRLSPYCFCIYIIHPVFLNVMFKVMHIEHLIMFTPFVNMIMIVGTTFILSLAASYILHKIPFIGKKIL